MRAFLLGAILFLVPIFQGSGAAHANPVLLQPLSDQELAANAAGRAFTIALDVQTGNGPAAGTEMTLLTQSPIGIRTLVREAGTASLSQAEMSLDLRATLTIQGGPRPAF